MSRSINLTKFWERNQHLNFGEVYEIVERAERELEDASRELLKQKFRKAGRREKPDRKD